MKKILLASSGRGKELAELLRSEFGIPAEVKWFEIRFAINEPVTVTCQFIATAEEKT